MIGRYIGNGERVTLGDLLVASAALAALRTDADHAPATAAMERLLDARGELSRLAVLPTEVVNG